jgi:hypothetical protein
MHINNTNDWIRYLESALHWGWSFLILVCVYEKQDDVLQQDLEVTEDDDKQAIETGHCSTSGGG